MPAFHSWKSLAVVILAHAALQGCASLRASAAPPQVAEQLRTKAALLCQYGLLQELVPSRLPEAATPGDFIRQEDLFFLLEHPSRVPLTALDKQGLHDEWARHVRCEVTDVTGGTSTNYFTYVTLRRTAPRWESSRLKAEDLSHVHTREQLRARMEEWSQQEPELTTTEHRVTFVRTNLGWRASYLLPERDANPAEFTFSGESTNGPEGVTPPRKLAGPAPTFSQEALEKGVQGLFVARCVITREGRVRGCSVLQSVPYMDASILQSLYASQYTPVTVQGRPVSAEFIFNVRLQRPR